MNTNKNIDAKIKEKIESHEFPFSTSSWDQMDALLTENTTENKAITPILIMATILILFALAVVTFSSSPENTNINHFQIETATNDIFKDSTETKIIPEKTQSLNDSLNQNRLFKPNERVSSLAGKNDIFESNVIGMPPIPHEKIYLHLDRIFYKPGEAIWFTAYLRDANTLEASEISDIFYVELIAPNGNSLKKLTLIAENGLTNGDIQLNPDWVGGIYKIKAYSNYQKNFEEYFERDIQIQKSVLPNLRMELDFERETYSAGEKVIATLNLNTLSNQLLANQDFKFHISLDGKGVQQKTGKTSKKGQAKVEFFLPKDLETNDGLLNVLINYNGQNESIARSIPIILNQIDLQFMPEGGTLVAGLPTRIAFKTLDEFGKPADLEGIILNEKGEEIISFKSYHQGMGVFDFQPLLGEKYIGRITKPKGIQETFELPEILEKGVVLNVQSIDNEKIETIFIAPVNWKGTAVLRHEDTIYETKEID